MPQNTQNNQQERQSFISRLIGERTLTVSAVLGSAVARFGIPALAAEHAVATLPAWVSWLPFYSTIETAIGLSAYQAVAGVAPAVAPVATAVTAITLVGGRAAYRAIFSYQDNREETVDFTVTEDGDVAIIDLDQADQAQIQSVLAQ